GREISSLSVGLQVPEGDFCLRDHTSGRVGNRNVQGGQLLCGKLGGKQQGKPEKSRKRTESFFLHLCPRRFRVRWDARRRVLRNPASISECGTPYLRLTGSGNITKALEIAAGSPCKIFVHAVQHAKETPMQSVKQEPIYLPDVENNPQPSHYADMIQKMQNSGGEYWQIWHLFASARRPRCTWHASPRASCANLRPSVPGCGN